jgi:DNA-directed RNA polymerase II subunit RPB2
MSPRKICGYAQSILQKAVLPHVGTEEHCEGKKVSLLDVHKLLMCKLGATEDDRDHFGKSDWIWRGRCLGGLFRLLFANLPRT